MTYKLSDVDKKNFSWFEKNASRRSLTGIKLSVGTIRGLAKLSIDFKYPLSAIAGRNGSGKSTVLALAACAYHNDSKSWKLPGRNLPYYRFSDFFVQTQDEVPLEGVQIAYSILHDNWKVSEHHPTGSGIGIQVRQKSKGGKWNDYDTRLKRQVAFFGVDRVVPPSERSVLKNQRQYFSPASAKKSLTEEATRKSVARVLGINYDDFDLRGFGTHKLPHVRRSDCQYSGFNMGAGEQALFGLFLAIHSANASTLFVIDEIELGLHEAAQRALITELKNISFQAGHQFIFTTHSPSVLECLPPEARFFLEKTKDGTRAIDGISPAYAAGRMAEKPSAEAFVYVEDASAKQLVQSALNSELRRRVQLIEVGSNGAVIAQANARFVDREHDRRACIFVLDGDQRAALATHRGSFLKRIGSKNRNDAETWFDARIFFLPSESLPERFATSLIREHHVDSFVTMFGLDNEQEAVDILDKALVRDAHSEVHWIAEDLSLPKTQIWQGMCQIVASQNPELFEEIRNAVGKLLSN